MDFATDFDTLRMLNSQGYYFYNNNNNNNNNNNMEPLSALAIGSSIIGGIGNLFGQNEANRTQMAIAQKQMDWQTQENQKNRDYQTEMWNRQNEYNTPANQRKLLQDAGYNPFVLQQNGSTSGAGAAGTPSMVGAPNMPHIQPVNPLGGVSSLMDALTLSMQNKQADSNVALQKSEIIQNMAKMAIESYDKLGFKGFKDLWNHLEPALASINFEGSRSDVLFNETLKNFLSQRYNQDMDSLNKEIEYNLGKKYGEARIQANLEKLNYDISEIVARLNTMRVQNDALIRQTAADLVVKGAHAFMLKQEGNKFAADAKTANDLREYLKKSVKARAASDLIDSYWKSVDLKSSDLLIGYMTSEEGRERKARSYGIDLEQRSSDLIRALDKVLGEYISITGSVTPHQGTTVNRNYSQIFPSTYSTTFYQNP